MMICAFDPGGTTGWARWCNDDEGEPIVIAGQSSFDALIREVEELEFEEGDVIVAERFTINAQTVRHSQQTTALEVIGYLRAVALTNGLDFVLQTPADAKRFAQVGSDKNARLVSLGWLQRPLADNDHANDALRHLVLYLVKNKIIEPPRVAPREKCTCEQMGNGVISGNDGRLPPAEGCPRHG
jgi:hypothetical protein